MQNAHVVSRPEFYALSNGALSSVYRKLDNKLFMETVLAFNLHIFST
jgi:hypothetical protein